MKAEVPIKTHLIFVKDLWTLDHVNPLHAIMCSHVSNRMHLMKQCQRIHLLLANACALTFYVIHNMFSAAAPSRSKTYIGVDIWISDDSYNLRP